MNTVLSQQDINVFASDPQADKEQPGSSYYASGVEVRYTAVGKWWNWLWNTLTSWFTKHKADIQSMITEQVNLLSAAGLTPDATSNHQLATGYGNIAESYAEVYDNETIVEDGVERPVNKPYVVGGTIVLPSTELL